MIIFLLSGLWHGANWTFVVWGAYHGILFLPLILLGKNRKNMEIVADRRTFPKLSEAISILFTFILVVFGWIIFRAESLADAFSYIGHCFVNFRGGSSDILFGSMTTIASTIFMICFLQLFDWTQRHKSYGLQIVEGRPLLFRWSFYCIIFFFILLFAGQQAQFIYFQF